MIADAQRGHFRRGVTDADREAAMAALWPPSEVSVVERVAEAIAAERARVAADVEIVADWLDAADWRPGVTARLAGRIASRRIRRAAEAVSA